MRQLSYVFFYIMLFFVSGCDPVGSELAAGPDVTENSNLVYTFENLELEEGDVLTIWTKFSASYIKNNIIPIYKLKYNLSLDDSSLVNDETKIFENKDYIINSTYSEVDKDKGSEYFESNWTFEQKILEFPINRSGNYVLDYKMERQYWEEDVSFPHVSLIIRKR